MSFEEVLVKGGHYGRGQGEGGREGEALQQAGEGLGHLLCGRDGGRTDHLAPSRGAREKPKVLRLRPLLQLSQPD